MKRFALIPAFALAGVTAMYAQAPARTQKPSSEQTGQAHIATPSQKPADSTTARRNDNNQKKQKTNPPQNPGVKVPLTNPANGPAGTPTNPK